MDGIRFPNVFTHHFQFPTEFLLRDDGSTIINTDTIQNVDAAMIDALANQAKFDGAAVSCKEVFPETWKVLVDAGEMKEVYKPGNSEKNYYEESQDGLKVILILIVLTMRTDKKNLQTFIKSITDEPQTFGGALYRLGAILFGTHSSKVSLWLHFQFPTLERFFTFLFVISRLLNTWDRYNP